MNVQMLIKTCCFGLLIFGAINNSVAQETPPTKKYRLLNTAELEFLHKSHAKTNSNGIAKTTTCIDTLDYPYQKQMMLGDTTQFIGGFGLAKDTTTVTVLGYSRMVTDERLSLAFKNQGHLTIKGIKFPSANDPDYGKPEGVTVQATIYTVDNFYKPIDSLGSGTVFINQYGYQDYEILFDKPVVVQGDYAVVLNVPNHGEGCWIMGNDYRPNQRWDEGYNYVYNYIDFIEQKWVKHTIFYLGDDWEVLVAPIVEYSLTASASYTPTNPTVGEEVVLTNTNKTTFLSNRAFNMYAFKKYFELPTNDSTYVWNMADDADKPTIVASKNTSLTYAGPTHTPTLTVNSGFSVACRDAITLNIPSPKSGLNDNHWASVSVFPNPTLDLIYVDGLQSKRAIIELSDAQGNVLTHHETTNNKVSISTKDLSAGVYFVDIQSEDGSMHRRIVKQ